MDRGRGGWRAFILLKIYWVMRGHTALSQPLTLSPDCPCSRPGGAPFCLHLPPQTPSLVILSPAVFSQTFSLGKKGFCLLLGLEGQSLSAVPIPSDMGCSPYPIATSQNYSWVK